MCATLVYDVQQGTAGKRNNGSEDSVNWINKGYSTQMHTRIVHAKTYLATTGDIERTCDVYSISLLQD